VVVGIRPEDLEDPSFAADAPIDRRIHGVVDRREPMGSEVLVHVTVDAPLVVTEDTRELAADTGAEAVHRLEQQATKGKNRFVARMHPRTAFKVGDFVEVAVDTSKLHFFDRQSGEAVYGEPIAPSVSTLTGSGVDQSGGA
jgi:multiple sugar transport system ATP-binding protein